MDEALLHIWKLAAGKMRSKMNRGTRKQTLDFCVNFSIPVWVLGFISFPVVIITSMIESVRVRLRRSHEEVPFERLPSSSIKLMDNFQMTRAVGMLGYLVPEHTRTGKAIWSTDVYAFRAFLLQFACGRRPIELRAMEDVILVDWVFSCWDRGGILKASDPNLGTEFVKEEMELMLKLGLLCSHSDPLMRPSMRQVLHYLVGDIPTPELSSIGSRLTFTFGHHQGFDDLATDKAFSQSSYVAESILSGGTMSIVI